MRVRNSDEESNGRTVVGSFPSFHTPLAPSEHPRLTNNTVILSRIIQILGRMIILFVDLKRCNNYYNLASFSFFFLFYLKLIPDLFLFSLASVEKSDLWYDGYSINSCSSSLKMCCSGYRSRLHLVWEGWPTHARGLFLPYGLLSATVSSCSP